MSAETMALWSNRGNGILSTFHQRERNLCFLLRELYDAKMSSDWTKLALVWDAAFDLCHSPVHLRIMADVAMDIGIAGLEGGFMTNEDVTTWMRRSVTAALELRKVDESDERAAEFTNNLAKAYVKFEELHLAESCADFWMRSNKNLSNSGMFMIKLYCILKFQRPVEEVRSVLKRRFGLLTLDSRHITDMFAMLCRIGKYEELAREFTERALLKVDQSQKEIWHVWRIRTDIRNGNVIAAYDDLTEYIQWFFARKAGGDGPEDLGGYESVVQDCEWLVDDLKLQGEQREIRQFCQALIFLCEDARDPERRERFVRDLLEATLLLEGLEETQHVCTKFSVDVRKPQFAVIRLAMAVSSWDVDAINAILQSSAESREIGVPDKLRLLLELSKAAKSSTAFEMECDIGLSVPGESLFVERLLAQPNLSKFMSRNLMVILIRLAVKLRLFVSLSNEDKEKIKDECNKAIYNLMDLFHVEVPFVAPEHLEWFQAIWRQLSIRPSVPPLDRFRLLEQSAPVSVDLRSRLDCRLTQLAAAVAFVRQRKDESGPTLPHFEDGFLQAVVAAVGECGQILASEEPGDERDAIKYFMFKVKLALLLYDDLDCIQAVLQDSYSRRNPRLILALCAMLKQEVRELGFSRCIAVDGLVLHSLYVATRIAVSDRSRDDDDDGGLGRAVFLFDVLICEALDQRRRDVAAQHVAAFGSFLSSVNTNAGALLLGRVQNVTAKIAVKIWNSAVEAGFEDGGNVELGSRLKQLCRSLLPYAGEHRFLIEGHLYVFS